MHTFAHVCLHVLLSLLSFHFSLSKPVVLVRLLSVMSIALCTCVGWANRDIEMASLMAKITAALSVGGARSDKSITI